MAERIEVAIPVFATVGPVHLRLFPYREQFAPPDESHDMPWAWGALCRVTFHFGDLVTTKKIQQTYRYTNKLGWATPERPSDLDLEQGRMAVLDNLRVQVARHGFRPPEFDVIEEDMSAAAVFS